MAGLIGLRGFPRPGKQLGECRCQLVDDPESFSQLRHRLVQVRYVRRVALCML